MKISRKVLENYIEQEFKTLNLNEPTLKYATEKDERKKFLHDKLKEIHLEVARIQGVVDVLNR